MVKSVPAIPLKSYAVAAVAAPIFKMPVPTPDFVTVAFVACAAVSATVVVASITKLRSAPKVALV